MTSSFPIILLILVLLLVPALNACAAPPPSAAPASKPLNAAFARVTLPDTELRQLNSSATGRSYDIYIRLPDAYARDRGKKYPVLYVLDGQWDFKLLDSIQSGLLYDKFVPEMIIVGITY